MLPFKRPPLHAPRQDAATSRCTSNCIKLPPLHSEACSAVFKSKKMDGDYFLGEMPTCAYRDDNKTKQDIMCQHLVAFADYNSIPLCNAGDVLIESMKTTAAATARYLPFMLLPMHAPRQAAATSRCIPCCCHFTLPPRHAALQAAATSRPTSSCHHFTLHT